MPSYPDQAADPAWLRFQTAAVCLDGFFDDSLVACAASLIPMVAEVILTTADLLQLECKTSKLHCGLPGNRTGPLDAAHWLAHRQVRFDLGAGQMVGIGKLFDLDHQVLRDSPAFLDKLDSSIQDIVDNTTLFRGANNAGATKVCPVSMGATALGRLHYCVSTTPHDASLLAGPGKMIRVSNAVLTTLRVLMR